MQHTTIYETYLNVLESHPLLYPRHATISVELHISLRPWRLKNELLISKVEVSSVVHNIVSNSI